MPVFDLGNALQKGDRALANEQNREFNSLRLSGERQRQDIQRREFTADQQQQNTRKLLRGVQIASQNPSLLPRVLDELARSQLIKPEVVPQMLQAAQNDPAAFQKITDDFEAQLMFALGEDPEQFGAPVAGEDVEGNALFRRFSPTGSRDVEGFVPRARGASGGRTGSLQELDAINADRAAAGQRPLPAEQFLTSRRQNSVDQQAFNRFKAENPGDTTSFEDFIAGFAGKKAGATETAKQQAQIAAIPERVETEFRAEFKAGAQKRIRAANDAIARIDSVMEEAQLAIDDIGATTTGMLGSINRKIAGTKSFALARKIDTIQANLSFDRIAEMRKNSPTGGALGQVSERELSLLGAAVVALDQANSEDEVRRAFTKVLFHYNNWKGVLTGQKDADQLLSEGDLSSQQNDEQLIEKAQQAIEAGADPVAVKRRLSEMGVDTSGL